MTLSQSQLKEFCPCPSPAPSAGHVTSQLKDTPLALTRSQGPVSACISSREWSYWGWGICSVTLAPAGLQTNDEHLFQYVTARHDTWHWVWHNAPLLLESVRDSPKSCFFRSQQVRGDTCYFYLTSIIFDMVFMWVSHWFPPEKNFYFMHCKKL